MSELIICGHCKENFDYDKAGEILSEELYEILICPKCGFPTSSVHRVITE